MNYVKNYEVPYLLTSGSRCQLPFRSILAAQVCVHALPLSLPFRPSHLLPHWVRGVAFQISDLSVKDEKGLGHVLRLNWGGTANLHADCKAQNQFYPQSPGYFGVHHLRSSLFWYKVTRKHSSKELFLLSSPLTIAKIRVVLPSFQLIFLIEFNIDARVHRRTFGGFLPNIPAKKLLRVSSLPPPMHATSFHQSHFDEMRRMPYAYTVLRT